MGEYYYLPALGTGTAWPETVAVTQYPKVDFWLVLCHNLFVSAPSPITDRELLTGQLYADETSPAIRTAVYQRYAIPPIDGGQRVPHVFPQRGDERVADVAAPVATM
jgi:hypothetical protein